MFEKFRIASALFGLLLFSILTVPTAFAADKTEKPHVSVRLLPEKTDLRGGETFTVGIEEKMEDGWHTYWVNPGDSGNKAQAVGGKHTGPAEQNGQQATE